MSSSKSQFKKVKKDAHEIQIGEYEQYQSQEVIELTKVIQAKQLNRISKLNAELKDNEELTEKLAELQAKLDKEALTRRKQVNYSVKKWFCIPISSSQFTLCFESRSEWFYDDKKRIILPMNFR